jgi:hypothetical protein
MENPRETLRFALEKYPDKIDILPVEQILMESARQNEKRPAYLKVAVPDQIVKTLRGRGDDRDLVLLVQVPSEVLGRADSPILLPGEID